MPEAGTLAEYVGWWILKRRKFFNKEMIPFFEKGNLEIAVKRELAAARDDYNKVFLRIRTALKKMR